MRLNVQEIDCNQIDILSQLYQKTIIEKETYIIEKYLKLGHLKIFVLYRNKVAVGELRALFISNNKQKTIDWQRVYFHNIYIDAESQNNGCGQYLIKKVMLKLEKCGYSQFALTVDSQNAKAKHIYHKLGFDKVLDEEHVLIDDNLCKCELLLRDKRNCGGV